MSEPKPLWGSLWVHSGSLFDSFLQYFATTTVYYTNRCRRLSIGVNPGEPKVNPKALWVHQDNTLNTSTLQFKSEPVNPKFFLPEENKPLFDVFSKETLVEHCLEVSHAANRFTCQAFGDA